jgi:hypothetical protein
LNSTRKRSGPLRSKASSLDTWQGNRVKEVRDKLLKC